MILKKIVIKNIRCHSYFEFEPEINGTTSICGENGTGKSTIVDSLSWALFGTRLHGLKNNSYIKEGVDPKTNEVSVEVYLYSGNREYKIKREIKNSNGNSECNVYSRPINSDEEFKFESGPSITYAEEFIRKVLGLNEKGFFASTFIQQKQVDQIVSATPKERGEVIEQLLGISSIVEAISISKERIRDLQKSAGLIHYKPQKEELDKLNNLKKEAKELSEEISKDRSKLKDSYDNLILSEKNFKEKTEKREKIEALEIKKNELENQYKILQGSLGDKIYLVEKLGGSNKVNIDKFEVIENKYKEVIEKNTKYNSDLVLNKNKLEELDKLYKIKIDNDTPVKYKKCKEDLKVYEEKMKDVAVHISITETAISDNRNFLLRLEDGATECPFCGETIKNIEKEKEKHTKIINELKKDRNKYTEEYGITLKEIKSLENSIESLEKAALIKKEQNEKKEEYNNVKENISKLNSEILSISTEVKIATEEYDKAKLAKSNNESLIQLKKDISQINNDLKDLKKLIEDVEKDMEQIGIITSAEYKIIFKEFNNQKDSFNSEKIKFIEKESQLKLIKEKGKEALSEYRKNEELIEKYTELMRELEILNATNDSLLAFKESRVNASIPALTSIASELYSKFTEGEFIEMKLSADFKATVVTKDGIERPVAQLSGGELSSAAIALRLAIAIFLHNNQPSLLILDEVLVSMSENRSQIILESIASMSQSQIIFIAHSNIANSFADKIVNVERN